MAKLQAIFKKREMYYQNNCTIYNICFPNKTY
jgi:hypothetical protein